MRLATTDWPGRGAGPSWRGKPTWESESLSHPAYSSRGSIGDDDFITFYFPGGFLKNHNGKQL